MAVLVCFSLMSDVEHLAVCFLTIRVSPAETFPFKSSAYF